MNIHLGTETHKWKPLYVVKMKQNQQNNLIFKVYLSIFFGFIVTRLLLATIYSIEGS